MEGIDNLKMSIQIEHLAYNGNNIKFIETVIEKLGRQSRNILYRASEQESLEKYSDTGLTEADFQAGKHGGTQKSFQENYCMKRLYLQLQKQK